MSKGSHMSLGDDEVDVDVDDDVECEEDTKAWSVKKVATFVDLLEEEAVKGNQQITQDNWKTLRAELSTRTGYAYRIGQIKNKYNFLRTQYRDFKKVLAKTSGAGWNRKLGTVILEDSAWEKLSKVIKNPTRFKKKGCPHYEQLSHIFGGTTVTGQHAHSSVKPPYDSINEMDQGEKNSKLQEEGAGDNVVQHGNSSASGGSRKRSNLDEALSSMINAYVESIKKRNEILEKRFIHSSSYGNDEAQSEKKDVDEDLMECFEILNNMEDIGGESYSKALKLLRTDAIRRKLFVCMPEKRKKDFVNNL